MKKRNIVFTLTALPIAAILFALAGVLLIPAGILLIPGLAVVVVVALGALLVLHARSPQTGAAGPLPVRIVAGPSALGS